MNEEQVQKEEQQQEVAETKHEPHPHARPRIMIGVGAVVLVAVLGVVWAKWSEPIKEFCFGEDGACPVELPETPGEGSAELFDENNPETFEGAGISALTTDVDTEEIGTELPPVPDAPASRSE